MPERKIYTLDKALGRVLTPEQKAAIFAKVSRSPKSFKKIAEAVSEEKASEFHAKWVKVFGHGSIADHAVLSIALENVSRLAVESIESNRLAGFTEKSTRYQKISPDSFYVPPEIRGSDLEENYLNGIEALFGIYEECRNKGLELDVCRYLLPNAILTNVGMTINARSLHHAVVKMLSNPLTEVQDIGKELLEVGQQEMPGLIGNIEPSNYLIRVRDSALKTIPEFEPSHHKHEGVSLTDYAPADGEDTFLATVLYRYSEKSFRDTLEKVRAMDSEEKEDLVREFLSDRAGEMPVRDLESLRVSFEIVSDQGAFNDLKRHRMLTLIPQEITIKYGYAIPALIKEKGLLEDYENAIKKAEEAYREVIVRYPEEAKYLVTQAHNRRYIMDMNLRELFYLCELRTRKEGHPAYRRISMKMYELAKEVFPTILNVLSKELEGRPSSKELEEEFFYQV